MNITLFPKKHVFLILALFSGWLNAIAQIPSSCFEIESILVDACGSPEGENEMVIFRVGNTALNTADLTVSWPSNSWLGICQDAGTASKVATLNAGIESCGYLIEPTAGVLPAGARVLIVTSTNMSTAANSFTNLADTLYIIFQCQGNTNGHFVNYNSTPAIRTLIIDFASPVSCSDTVSYDRSLLLKQNLQQGSQDGALVEYAWDGTATYNNRGCQAPFTPISSNITTGGNDTICQSGSVTITGIAGGSYSSVFWTCPSGSFSQPDSLITNYTAEALPTGIITLSFNVVGLCDDTVKSTYDLHIKNPPNASISGNLSFCEGQSTSLMASGEGNYFWSPSNETATTINVNTAGNTTLTVTNMCGSDETTVTTSTIPLPSATITADGSTTFCAGDSVKLSASGTGSFAWSTGATSNEITVYTANNYTLTATNICGDNTDSEEVIIEIVPVASIVIDSLIFCEGDSMQINASGGDSYLWNTSETGNSIYANNPGTYFAIAFNSCGEDTSATVTLTTTQKPSIAINGDSSFCSGDSILLNGTGGINYLWSTGKTGSSIYIKDGGTYTVTSQNACGTDTATITIDEKNPTSMFTSNPVSGITPLTVGFTNESDSSGVFSWLFGEEDSSSVFSPNYTFNEPGSYEVTLYNNIDGCIATSSMIIIVKEGEAELIIPDVFTPNGDEVNDLFYVKHTNIIEFNARIFNRWGTEVYTLPNANATWDGRSSSGTVLSEGTYFYIIKAKGLNNEDYNLQGTVTLLR